MVKQGTIIKINFNPQLGHEQAGYRPALVISNNSFNKHTNLTIVCPITNTNRNYPLHIPLDANSKTTGFIMCEQVRSLDLNIRPYNIVEEVSSDILDRVIKTVFLEIEKT